MLLFVAKGKFLELLLTCDDTFFVVGLYFVTKYFLSSISLPSFFYVFYIPFGFVIVPYPSFSTTYMFINTLRFPYL